MSGGQKEASSELLASICEALDLPLGELLHNVAADVSALDKVDTAAVEVDGSADQRAAERGEGRATDQSAGTFEGGRIVAGTTGNDLADLRLSPSLRTTIKAPKPKAVLAA